MCCLSKENKKQKQFYQSYSPNGWRYIMFKNKYIAVDRSLLKESMNILFFLRTIFSPYQNKSMHLQRTYVTRSGQAEKAQLH